MELATHQAPPVDGPGLLLGFGFGLGLGLGFGFGFGLGLGLGFGLGFMYGAGFVIGCVVDGGGGLSIVGSGYVVPGVVGLMMGTSSWSEYMEGEIAMSSSWNASFLLFLMAFVGCLSAMLVPEVSVYTRYVSVCSVFALFFRFCMLKELVVYHKVVSYLIPYLILEPRTCCS